LVLDGASLLFRLRWLLVLAIGRRALLDDSILLLLCWLLVLTLGCLFLLDGCCLILLLS